MALSLTDIARQLSKDDINRLLALKQNEPKLLKLEAELKKLTDELADVDRQIAALEGGRAPKAPGKRGRPAKTANVPAKRGRPPKTTAVPAKRGRPPKAAAVPAKRGRPPKAKPAGKVVRTKPEAKSKRTPSGQAAINARMAKARAARKKSKK